MRTLTIRALAILAFLLPAAAQAQTAPEGTVELKVIAESEFTAVTADGEQVIQRAPSAKVVPGDEVIYTILFTNTGTKPAEHVVVTNPIPDHMVFVRFEPDSTGAPATLSVDGGRSFDQPEKLRVTDAAGHLRPAEPADYTHVRWCLVEALAPGGQGSVSYRVQLQ